MISSVFVMAARERRSLYSEVSEVEKQLWARIHSNGVLHKDVKDLYRKACCIYEKLFLRENVLRDLQNIEYLLWRLQYKHIDEFRRVISQTSAKDVDGLTPNLKMAATAVNTGNLYTDNFRLFLSEATMFYQDLIRKIKTYYGLLDEPWFYKNEGVLMRIEQTRLHKCQFVCHRLCICLGDLARYIQLYEKLGRQQRNWSVAASYYLEAAKIYPDGGNPQNQLAVLATYIGDGFLALYHCIRSLAVKEPFPDALQNLIMLFEKNRSSNIVSLTDEVYDFCKPSDWISNNCKSSTSLITTKVRPTKLVEHDTSSPSDFWILFIRLTSFFFLDSRLDDFTSTFTSTLRELEVLLALDVAGLSSALQSYQNMNLSKAGPYRALHIISVLLFAIFNLTVDCEHNICRPVIEGQQSLLVRLALTSTFTFMGRLVDRCLQGSPVVYFPLLPALLVFVEWLMGDIEKIDADDEKTGKAKCYFFCSFVKLLNHLQENRGQMTSPANIALWEDYELRGFIPLSQTYGSLDFSSHWEEQINYKMKNEYRAHRIVQAAIAITRKSSDKTSIWLNYDEPTRKFTTTVANDFMHRKDLEERKFCPDFKAKKSQLLEDNRNSILVDEEEDIVFKPIARQNSEPIKMKAEPITTSMDSLHRASSLLVGQASHSIPSVSSGKQPGQNEYSPNDSPPSRVTEGLITAGPPSLSSWVQNGDKLSGDRVTRRETNRTVLTSIQEITSTDFRSISITTAETFCIACPVTCPSNSCCPEPCAPLLPSNVVWFPGIAVGCNVQTTVPDEPLGCGGSSYPSDIFQESPGVSSLKHHCDPIVAAADARPCGSSQFPSLQNQYYPTRNINTPFGSGTSGFGLLDHWSFSDPLAFPPGAHFKDSPPLFRPSPSLLHGAHEQRRGFPNLHYQQSDPGIPPLVQDAGTEPQPLLQYLKEREYQLQESQITGGGSYSLN